MSKFSSFFSKFVTFGRLAEPLAEAAATSVAAITGNPTANLVAVDLSLLRGVTTTVSGQLQAVKAAGATDAEVATVAAPLILTAIENSGFLNGKQITDVSKYNGAVNNLTLAFLNLEAQLQPAAPAGPALAGAPAASGGLITGK